MQIQISWLLQKPTDLDLHCLLRQGMLCSAREGLRSTFLSKCIHFLPWSQSTALYGKCSKILYAKFSDKMAYANSADPDQTAFKGAVWSGSTLFAISLSILGNNCIKNNGSHGMAVATAGDVQEMELNAQTKYCSAKHEKQVKVSNGQLQWAGCVMVDVCMKFH